MNMKLYWPNFSTFKIKCQSKDKLIQNRCQNNPIWRVLPNKFSP